MVWQSCQRQECRRDGLLFVLISLRSPRLGNIILWLFTDWVYRAFSTWLWLCRLECAAIGHAPPPPGGGTGWQDHRVGLVACCAATARLNDRGPVLFEPRAGAGTISAGNVAARQGVDLFGNGTSHPSSNSPGRCRSILIYQARMSGYPNANPLVIGHTPSMSTASLPAQNIFGDRIKATLPYSRPLRR